LTADGSSMICFEVRYQCARSLAAIQKNPRIRVNAVAIYDIVAVRSMSAVRSGRVTGCSIKLTTSTGQIRG
jgi:hypothetical protein